MVINYTAGNWGFGLHFEDQQLFIDVELLQIIKLKDN